METWLEVSSIDVSLVHWGLGPSNFWDLVHVKNKMVGLTWSVLCMELDSLYYSYNTPWA